MTDNEQLAGELSPEDLEGLPDDILNKLGLRTSETQELLIKRILKRLGGAATIPKICVEIYKETGDTPDRNTLGAKLYRMSLKGSLKSSVLGCGWYCLPDHESANDTAIQLEKLEPPLSPACYVAMPKELTAENGAKALMMGEFYETVETGNEAFCGCGTCDFCIEFPDEPESTLQKIPISWTTIKEIYAMAVKHFDAVHTPPIEDKTDEQ
jgi:hypothetical protein